MRTFTMMLERSQCVLRSLHLEYICLPQAQFVALLEKVPRLQDFTITNHNVTNDPARPDRPTTIGDTVLERMIVREGADPALLSELRVLKIDGSLHFDPEVLVEMVKSRTNPRLEHLHLHMDGKSVVDVNEPLEGRLKGIMGEKGYTWSWSADISFRKRGVLEAMGRAMEEEESRTGMSETST
uniref:Expressed protein n=2 Tax=Schizophyllum commune (strain H4-8 / FGSC 9210) TaxID=578458 RepID=D8QDH9_SCHCM